MSQTNEKTNRRKALGIGLDQLFSNNNVNQLDFDTIEKTIIETTPENEIKMIPVDEIRSNPYQPRIHFDQDALNELAESIKEHGVLEPIIVKKSIKGYELVAGERRTKASKIAGKTKIPAIIKDFDDQSMMEIALLENIQRENLTPIEEAKAYKNFMTKMNLTQEEVASKFKKSRSYVTNMLGLLKLPSEVQRDVVSGKISMSHARVLSKLEDEEEILRLAKKIKEEGISVHALENLTQNEEVIKRKPIKRDDTNKILYKIYEKTMKDTLGTKVSIGTNKITINFNSSEDLNRLLEIMNIKVGE
ncbi:MAG: ParB/RepB/Spo0J family partition protein [Bacilli bacterium]|nr:ParB/RepB/Spo0J family partition protein [Bacilli bacterium]